MSLAGLVLASLLLVDPSGDAHGGGDLTPPTAGVYSSTAPFDLVEVEVLEGSTLALRVRLAERPNPGDLANGITLPVIDLYVDSEEGGARELLPGPGLLMPPERGWEVAVRVTGDAAFARRASDEAQVDHRVTVTPDGDALVIATPFEAPERAPRVHALTGVYDAFDADAWRPLARAASPWAFSSETARFPVVDVLAEDDAAQQAALESGVLPLGRSPDPAAPWLVLMVLGLLIALAGLLLRSRVGRAAGPRERPRPARDEDAEGTRVYDVDADHAAPLWGVDGAEGAVGLGDSSAAPDGDAVAGHESERGADGGAGGDRPSPAEPARGRGTVDTAATRAPSDGYDEAMLGPAAAAPAAGGTDDGPSPDDEDAAAVLRESDLFDPGASEPPAPRPLAPGEPVAADPAAGDGDRVPPTEDDDARRGSSAAAPSEPDGR